MGRQISGAAPGPKEGRIPRRAFLVGATTAVGTVGLARAALASEGLAPVTDPEVLAREHADDPAVLVDVTRCVGCGRCVEACKEANDLPWREDQPPVGPEATLASSNYSAVRARSVMSPGETPLGPLEHPVRRYVKVQCMHCLEPACASACFMGALRKSEDGPVRYDPSRCVGCRYCMVACPFGVPAFDWDSAIGRIQKCELCPDRLARGLPPACTAACPRGAITFGRRGELLEEAHRRIATGRYVPRVYGEEEVGGTSVLYLSDVPFEELGFPVSLPSTPLSTYTWRVTRLIPPTALGILGVLTLLHRRRRLEAAEVRALAEQVEGELDEAVVVR